MSSLIAIHNLLIQRNGRDVLKVRSLEIKHGETLALVGPNGAGKSTLVLALAHLIQHKSGEILFNEKPVSQKEHILYQ